MHSPCQGAIFVESFAGQGEASKAVKSLFSQHDVSALDLQYSKSMDINSCSGFGILGWQMTFCFWGGPVNRSHMIYYVGQ